DVVVADFVPVEDVPVTYVEVPEVVEAAPARVVTAAAEPEEEEPAPQATTTPAPTPAPVAAAPTPAPAQAPARIMVNGVIYAVQGPAPAASAPAQVSPAVRPAVAVSQVAAAPRPAAVCDGMLPNGCYLAKRKFSTPQGGAELRCT